jgi:SAM-dependent methyltransferase
VLPEESFAVKRRLDIFRIRLQHLRTSLPYILKSELIFRRLMMTIDLPQLREITRTYKSMELKPGQGGKFVNSPRYIRQDIIKALLLRLDGPPKCNVLDLGSGPGYFPMVCRYLGHSVQALDITDSPLFNDLIRFFEIPRIVFRIQAFKSLPPMNAPFDLITAWGICFDRGWGTAEWEFFMRDLVSRLSSAGRIVLGLNAPEVGGIDSNYELKTFFDSFPGFKVEIMDRRTVVFYRQVAAS